MRSAILLAAMIIGDAILPNQQMSQGKTAEAVAILFMIFCFCDLVEFIHKLSKGK